MEIIINILLGRVDEPYKQRYHQEKIKTNISRMFGLSIYMLLIQILLNVINIVKPADTKNGHIMLFVGLSMAAVSVGLVFVLLSILCRKRIIANERILWFLPYLLMYLYAVIQMAFFILNLQEDNGSINSYVIAVILLSFPLIIKPIVSFVNVLVCMGYAFTMMYMTRMANRMWDSVMITDTWANLIIITLLVLSMSTISYWMYMSNFINRMKLEDSVRHAEELARIDTLTGVMNRRGFFEWLESCWPDLLVRNRTVAAVMFDIDNFKEFNDRLGHLAGDRCLLAVSATLQEYFHRYNGRFCRFGGEEFLAVFYPGESCAAGTVIENARRAVEEMTMAGAPADCRQITISAGYEVGKAGGMDYEALIKRADMALYDAKRSGRNKIAKYRPSLERKLAEDGR